MDWKLPNMLSLSRIVIAPLFLYLFLKEDTAWQQFSIMLYILGAITDYYDGYFARKFNQESSFGKFVDPLADKLHTSAAFIAFVFVNVVPLWMVVIIVVRDFGTTILRIIKKSEFKTSLISKMKTAVQLVFISAVLILFYIKDMHPESELSRLMNGWIYSEITYYSMFLITILTVLTLLDYLKPRKN